MATPQRYEFPDLDRFPFTPQNSSKVALVPYAEVNGIWTVPDDMVLELARQAKTEGTFDGVFLEGRIDGPQAFLMAMKQPAVVPVFFFVGQEPIGVACLTGCEGRRAFGHFLFLSNAWGKHTQQAGKLCLDYWFSFKVGNQSLFDVILGIIPTRNQRAIEFVQKIGMSVLGSVPKMVRGRGGPEAATIVYMTR